jgi:hypothetical protein
VAPRSLPVGYFREGRRAWNITGGGGPVRRGVGHWRRRRATPRGGGRGSLVGGAGAMRVPSRRWDFRRRRRGPPRRWWGGRRGRGGEDGWVARGIGSNMDRWCSCVGRWVVVRWCFFSLHRSAPYIGGDGAQNNILSTGCGIVQPYIYIGLYIYIDANLLPWWLAMHPPLAIGYSVQEN